MKINFMKAAFIGLALFSSMALHANPIPNFTTTHWFSMIKTLKNNTETKKQNCVYSNIITITVFKCDEQIVDNAVKEKDVLTASTRN
jgi:hypothetical protein